ncbi:MAG: flagellar filament outer layer protein FlaA, partial [Treponema sp.]|nr:flagellar filament outer layer protein FlaA [Treponema sp.]
MKQGSFKAFWLVVMAVMAVSFTFGDENTSQLESIILDSFDGDSGYTWKIQGSKFASKKNDEEFPKLTYAATWPTQIWGQNEDGKELKSLGIWGNFDRRGYNWIDIYPTGGEGGEEGVSTPISMPGRSQILDIWVWGSNLSYQLEAYVQDYRGVTHMLPMGL